MLAAPALLLGCVAMLSYYVAYGLNKSMGPGYWGHQAQLTRSCRPAYDPLLLPLVSTTDGALAVGVGGGSVVEAATVGATRCRAAVARARAQ